MSYQQFTDIGNWVLRQECAHTVCREDVWASMTKIRVQVCLNCFIVRYYNQPMRMWHPIHTNHWETVYDLCLIPKSQRRIPNDATNP